MTKARGKASDPEQSRQERLERQHEARELAGRAHLAANANVSRMVEERGKIVPPQRGDVFTILYGREGLSLVELSAVRRLEADLALQREESRGPAMERVDGTRPQPRTLQNMIDVAKRVEAVLGMTGLGNAKLLLELIQPSTLYTHDPKRWRAVVRFTTGADNPVSQAERVKAAVHNLLLAYQAWDQRSR